VQDRLEYATLSVRYLNTRAEIGLLGNLEFEDGTSVFNARELSHMQDVKSVYVPITNLGIGSMLALIILFMIGRRRPWKTEVIRGIRRGGWLTIGLVAAIGILAVSDFWTFFEKFHALFFEGDSWLFYYSDTLIRLFPLRFWQDIVLVLLLIIAGTGLALGLAVRPGGKPKVPVSVIV
jgi:integral membrane protein (TIGR01906 family)